MVSQPIHKTALPQSSSEGTLAFAAAIVLMIVISTVLITHPQTLAIFGIPSEADSL